MHFARLAGKRPFYAAENGTRQRRPPAIGYLPVSIGVLLGRHIPGVAIVSGRIECSDPFRVDRSAVLATLTLGLDVPKKISDVPTNKSCPDRQATNLLFYRSYGFFARTYKRPYDRTDEQMYLKKIATYLQTKVVRLKKLMERSVDPVDARPPHAAHGP